VSLLLFDNKEPFGRALIACGDFVFDSFFWETGIHDLVKCGVLHMIVGQGGVNKGIHEEFWAMIYHSDSEIGLSLWPWHSSEKARITGMMRNTSITFYSRNVAGGYCVSHM
jgi:hypothetical protein